MRIATTINHVRQCLQIDFEKFKFISKELSSSDSDEHTLDSYLAFDDQQHYSQELSDSDIISLVNDNENHQEEISINPPLAIPSSQEIKKALKDLNIYFENQVSLDSHRLDILNSFEKLTIDIINSIKT